MTDKAIGNIGLLLRSYDGLRNWRALVLLGVGVVVGALLAAAAGMITAKLGFMAGLLVALLALLVYLAGINGAGLLLVDQADGHESRGLGAAFFGGLQATITVFLALLLLVLGLLVVVLALYVLSFLGRIPGIGSLFAFLLAGPSAIVLAFCYGLLIVGIPLLLVAVWRGEGVLGSIGRAVDIVLKRPLDCLLHFVFLWLVVVPVAAFVLVVMALASLGSVAMYAAGGGIGSTMRGMGGYYGEDMPSAVLGSLVGGLQQAGAAMASVGVVMLVIMAMLALVAMFGYIMVYDSLGQGVQAGAAGRLRGGIGQVKQKLEQYRPRPTEPPVGRAQSTGVCAACSSPLSAGDQFCGVCGHKT